MKLCISLMLCFTLGLSASTLAQQERVNLDLKNVSIKVLFSEIQKQTNLSFVFNTEQTRQLGTFSVQANEETVESVLRGVLKNTGMTFEFEGNLIIIRPEPEKVAPDKINMKGIVKDERGDLLPGVTIRVKGTTLGFVTNVKGEFDIDLPKRDSLTLVFSFIGYQKQTVKVKDDGKPLNIVMKEELQAVEEVVVTGIFNKPKESFTGAVTTVTKEDIKANFSRNLLQTLSNLDPSFRILQNNKEGSNPNALPEIQLRGASTFANVNDLQLSTRATLNLPLFVLDGLEISLERVMDLNNEDIESITILKDAGATSLYGSRGANGVVVITSVTPQPGQVQVTYRGTVKIEVPDLSTYDLLNAKEKLDLEYRLGAWDNAFYQDTYQYLKKKVDDGFEYDWLALPTRTGVGQTHNLSVMGGSEAWRFSLNLSYDANEGVMKGSERKNFNGNLNLTYNSERFVVGGNFGVGTNNNANSPYGTFSDYANMNPYWEPKDENGETIYNFYHPLAAKGTINPAYNQMIGVWNKTRYTNIMAATNARFNVSKSFYLVGKLGLSRNFQQGDGFTPPSHVQFVGKEIDQKGRFSRNQTETNRWQVSLDASFAKTFADKHMLTLMGSGQLEEKSEDKVSWAATGFTSDNIDHPSMALGYGANTHPTGSESTTRRLALIFSGNYYYDMRYFLDVSFNANGSSSFGKESRWAKFYSVGAGWNISNENFFIEHMSFINHMKLKASYGVSGNMGFSPTEAMAVYNLDVNEDYLSHYGAYLNTFGNPNLKWQNTYQLNVGLELHTLNRRLEFEFNYYNKRTDNTVSDILLPVSHGFATTKSNTGVIRNEGYELRTTVHLFQNLDRGFTWNVTGRFARNINTIVELSEGFKETLKQTDLSMYTADTYYKYREGYSMDAIYGLRTVGVDPATGKRLFLTKDGRVTYNQNATDMVYLGDRQPKVDGNISTDISYKGFMLNVGFIVRFGGKQFNQTLASRTENAYLILNQDRRVLTETWQKPGDIVRYKKLALDNVSSNTFPCDEFIQKDNVFACSNINLSYNFPHDLCKRIGLRAMSFGTNLSDVFYISTIKRERGTGYPFSRNPNFYISCSF